jgi:hypothetical protein
MQEYELETSWRERAAPKDLSKSWRRKAGTSQTFNRRQAIVREVQFYMSEGNSKARAIELVQQQWPAGTGLHAFSARCGAAYNQRKKR